MADEETKQLGMGQVKQVFGDMSMVRRLAIFGLAALLMGGFVAVILWVNQADYQVLYSGLNQRDAASVVAKLKDLKIPYKIEGEGNLIKVPQDSLYETRLAMASAGLPRGGGVGFEVFNEVQMGATEFVQKINYQRALQGELARTIASFTEVEEARVHIVMPRESLFVEDEKKPSASVVVRLVSGRVLNKSQIQGIVYLVASAVPDLTAEGITVVDTNGSLLFRKEADTPGFPAALTASQLEYQRNIESTLKSKVQSMLEQVLGRGRAVVRVAADIDFTRTTTTEESFNPDQVAVRSETRSTEKSTNAGPGPAGTPDNRYALAARNAAPAEAQQSGSQSDRENETTNYEISTTKKQATQAIGGLKHISVAVMVDGTYRETPGAEGAPPTRTFVPRSPEEMRQLNEIVRRAVGYNENRGDEISLVNAPFALPSDLGVAVSKGWLDYAKEYGRPVLNFALAALFLLMVVRPLVKFLLVRARPAEAPMEAATMRPAAPGEELPPGAAAEEALSADIMEAISAPPRVTTRDVILALANEDPEKATSVLRAWIHETA